MADTIINEIPDPVYEDGIWKGAKINWPEGYYKFGERLLSQFKKYPDFVGQIDGATGEAETYRSMGERSIRCAIWLQKQGINKGDVIGLCASNHLDSAIPLFASLYLGTIINPWKNVTNKTVMNEETVTHYTEATKPKMLFVDEAHAEIVIKIIDSKKYSLPVVIFGRVKGLPSFSDILKTSSSDEVDKFECVKIKAEDPAVLLYTSGTTKSPKAVLHSYHSVANMMNYYEDDSKPSTVLWFSKIFWISGMRMILRSIIFKAKMILSDYYKTEDFFRLIEKYKVTRISMSVYKVHAICKTKEVWKYDLSSVEQVAFGAGVIKSEEVEVMCRLFKNADIYTRYSGTEFGTLLTGKATNKKNSSGKIFFNAEVKVVDLKTLKIVGPNEEGELLCRTPKLMTCYWNNPTATDEAIDSEGWYHTGDLGYYDSDGDFFVIDRISELLKVPGHYFSPTVIERVIEDIPGVAEVAVVAQPSSTDYDILMAFVTKVLGMEVSESDIHGVVEEKLPSAMKLQGGIRFLEKMPYTPSFKIVKGELRKMAEALSENSKVL